MLLLTSRATDSLAYGLVDAGRIVGPRYGSSIAVIFLGQLTSSIRSIVCDVLQHGRRKTGVAEKPSEASRRHEAEQIATYCQLKDQLLQRHREKCYDEESRSLSLKLVHMNPEFYTCWNYRRNALLSLFSHGETTAMTVDITADKTHDGAKDANAADAPSGGLAEAPSSNDPSVASSSPQPVDVAKMLDDELMLTLSCLKKYPKSYWVWNQRQWCLENHPQANWAQELKFVDKMLQMDARNCEVLLTLLLSAWTLTS
ncbi:protein prenylyltransferase [Caulochytrium protostelioides]|uniref:Geranylgeranyl transferase type-2 subunit alpha n=1 Tax=Caulochytrium protostelioides TaxID=1555241 RepID=A0A4P9WXX1_9FUNG|nr:protein prenylyltransferase [Caulochytrium protostelioides]